MARPRVFVSSTYYDLKHVRAQLELFIDSLGYDSVLSEKGQIAYAPDIPLDESCYREVKNCDIYVLVIGGRYGTGVHTSSSKTSKEPQSFYDRYESITKLEHTAASELNIASYILIDRSVYAEFQTFQKNRENRSIAYAHVDSVNVFRFIEEILAKPRNNPIQTFERFTDIQGWLKEQWAGLFRDMLHRQNSEQQLTSLASQVRELSEINTTLKRYLEEVLSKLSPEAAADLISHEALRLDRAQKISALEHVWLYRYLKEAFSMDVDQIVDVLTKAEYIGDLIDSILSKGSDNFLEAEILKSSGSESSTFRLHVAEARNALGLPALKRDPREKNGASGAISNSGEVKESTSLRVKKGS